MATRRPADNPVTPEPAARRATAPRTAAPRAKAASRVSAEDRRAMIAENAYLRAERRGFIPGHEESDWLAAEQEVDVLLGHRHGGAA
jgi:hypothetical protein